MLASRASWQNPRVLSTLLLVFLAGGLVGAFAMRIVHHGIRETLAYNPPGTNRLTYDQLKTELKLTPEQSKQLKSILNDFVRYDKDIQEQIEDFRATGKNRIRAILTPEQQARFEKLCAEMQTR